MPEPTYTSLLWNHTRKRIPGVVACNLCGALVADTAAHDRWHRPPAKGDSVAPGGDA